KGRHVERRGEAGPPALDVKERDERVEHIRAQNRHPNRPPGHLPELAPLAVSERGGPSRRVQLDQAVECVVSCRRSSALPEQAIQESQGLDVVCVTLQQFTNRRLGSRRLT